ncbi:unnamed protein product [Microthlaspi erraticum]|uniref:Legume lectin domain-containing protein n=1 Tax=Microthlaspi erraticum TaxID=1685480 RepID=A0A6D2JXW0_9BRAS|nr:unnamed protein product [Microthlaspi erraticum]
MYPSRKLLVLFFASISLSMAKPTFVSLPIMSISHSNPLRFEISRSSAIPISEMASSDSRESSAFPRHGHLQHTDPDSNTTASFFTHFSFSVQNVNPDSSGDGLSFFLSHDNDTLGSPGSYLGLVNSSQPMKNRFVAIEFNTKLDPHFNDPSGNHVGDSLNSIATSDPSVCLKLI